MSAASTKMKSSISQITRCAPRAIACSSTKVCWRELEPVIASFSDRTPSARSMSLWRKWIASEVPMKAVSNDWLRISPAFCTRVSSE